VPQQKVTLSRTFAASSWVGSCTVAAGVSASFCPCSHSARQRASACSLQPFSCDARSSRISCSSCSCVASARACDTPGSPPSGISLWSTVLESATRAAGGSPASRRSSSISCLSSRISFCSGDSGLGSRYLRASRHSCTTRVSRLRRTCACAHKKHRWRWRLARSTFLSRLNVGECE